MLKQEGWRICRIRRANRGNQSRTWAQARLEALAAEAEELAGAVLPARRPGAGQAPAQPLGPARGAGAAPACRARSAPGAFAIEWFTRRWVNKTATGTQTFTRYIRRGTGDRYPARALARVAQPWELALAEELEARFAEIRRLARSISRVRMAFRLHAKLERTVAERGEEETA